MGTPLLGNIQRRCGPAGSTGLCQTGKRRVSLLGTETSPGCMPKLGGLKYWGRAAGHMTLLKTSQGMTSNPCLSEGFEEGSSLPTAGLGFGGESWAGTQPQGHFSGKAFGPISLFSLFFGNWDLESAQGEKNVTYKQIALAICASLGDRSRPGRAQPLWSLLLQANSCSQSLAALK